MRTKGIRDQKVKVVTLGCSKNLVDSENIITQLKANDIETVHDEEADCDIAIINTCGFIDLAKEESVDTILEYVEYKKQGSVDKVYVTGCLSHRYKEDLERDIPEVDAYFGTMELPSLLHKFDVDYRHELIGERFITTESHFAYLKISEGCNRTCSFCAIPLMRGKHVSKPIDDLVREAENLARHGVKELLLIAQELTYYGLDIYKKRALSELLEALAKVEGIEWIRLHYAYPSKFPLEVLDTIREVPQVCNYLDIPLQHASDTVLKRMRRQITRQDTENLLARIRETVPGISIRTTMLVGFPGETDEDFADLVDFVKQQRFDRLGVFMYSHEEDTFAYGLVDDVPHEIKQARMNELMEVQREISMEKNKELIGSVIKVLIDRKEGDYFYGRTEYDSPEVDNEVLIRADQYFVRSGDFAEVLVEDATEYDLFVKPV
ncbi:30S ribosomal protein S12 methylthiotransferase RimO [Membranihabitans maritimus]|uniref:30S ribosomal protein S12 methylthiotransferase RimO n=1 Tax=Membranihabitans maritimus TaxID=2904244 RepID=UPI001F00A4B2